MSGPKKRKLNDDKDKELASYRGYFAACGVAILEGMMENKPIYPPEL
jgi:hypothetical protein